jgi:hypothetical protein
MLLDDVRHSLDDFDGAALLAVVHAHGKGKAHKAVPRRRRIIVWRIIAVVVKISQVGSQIGHGALLLPLPQLQVIEVEHVPVLK